MYTVHIYIYIIYICTVCMYIYGSYWLQCLKRETTSESSFKDSPLSGMIRGSLFCAFADATVTWDHQTED
jgi:hypothetical protein